MTKRVSYVGRRFGRLVVEEDIYDGYQTRELCQCDCGNKTTVLRVSLLRKKTKSCGCLQREKAKLSIQQHNKRRKEKPCHHA